MLYSRALVLVNPQKDYTVGSLTTRDARSVVRRIPDAIYRGGYDAAVVVMTLRDPAQDTTADGRLTGIPYCVAGSTGMELDGDVSAALDGVGYVEPVLKNSLGTARLADVLGRICTGNATVDFAGFFTDADVIANVLTVHSVHPSLRLSVMADVCAGTTREMHMEALDVMESCSITVDSEDYIPAAL